VLGCIERPLDRGGHSLYASLVYVVPTGEIASVHRKLMPTYEERLAWSPGDGHGLRVHALGAFRVGALNCWENWMPLARAALYGQGEDLHVAIWPGSVRNTQDITRFIALEARSYVLSVSGLLRAVDVPLATPQHELLRTKLPDVMANGGSCLAGPDGEWVIAPVVEQEALLVATLDHKRVREERQNFDPAGHYARPDVLQLTVNRRRQSTISLQD
jgi:nitrilase